jgi:hypothetical protein
MRKFPGSLTLVMAGLDPAIHQKRSAFSAVMGCRVKPGNDNLG